ncbi:AAA family ATPase [Leucobacter chinensis]|uniref:AAA family ATPase n=1 Tax=Leucobacter chinensis TaxID=2851010 RepID=UPI001C24CE49|nr:AAA family ATPase [Leucobacter chinensis]
MRKITKVQGSQHAGILQGWSMPNGVEDLARVNVIYGGNGSGKSTLARVFSEMTTTEPSDTVLHVDVHDAAATRRQVTDRSDPFWSRLRVFDKQFVRKNLLFDVNNRSDALPLLVLGEPNVQRDQQITEIDARLEELSSDLPKARNAADVANKAARKLATDTARTIGQELQAAGGRYSSRGYDARRVAEALLSIDEATHQRSDEEMTADLSIVQGQRLEPVSLVQNTEQNFRALEDDVATALGQTITNAALESLAGNPVNESWVQQGLRLHEHRDECLFCANPITNDRRSKLESHFDESFRNLQDQLQSLDQRLQQEEGSLQSTLSAAREPGYLYNDLQEQHHSRMQNLSTVAEQYNERIVALRAKVAQKLASPFSSIDIGQLPGVNAISFESVNEVLEQHNARSSSYQEEVNAAARRVEQSRLASIVTVHREHTQTAKEQSELADELQREQETIKAERGRLNVADLDASPLAEELTRDVASLLGRDELVFSRQDDRYSIQRNGKPATALSEGEQTAISLLYFLCSLRDEKTRGVIATVVIDDPVSSLDQEILVGASSHLWSALVGNGSKHQVILLTHSFELFRMWSNQLDRIRGIMKKQGGYSIYELRARYETLPDGSAHRRPAMISWTDENLRKKLRSQYHYHFWRVADVLQVNAVEGNIPTELEASVIIPNAARQMLEAFLAFKYPSKIGDFEGSMRRAFEVKAVDDPLRQRVTRFVHRQSHNEEADISKPVRIGEAIIVLRAAFEFINAVDPEHFTEMCSALDIDSQKILNNSASLGG